MNPTELEILTALEPGPSPLRGLLMRSPRSTVYRAARSLRARGLVARTGGGRWSATPAGLLALREATVPASVPSGPAPPPSLPVPALALMPTPVHAAVARLAVLAARARRRHPRHHLSFVLIGPPLRGKTWLMLAVARLLGADPAVSLLHSGMQTAGGLGARRNGRGEIAAVRDALGSPLIALDEFQRSTGAVKRAVAALLHGERRLALENDEALDVAAVVVVGLNPVEGGTLEQRIGLDAALIRRAVVVDFASVALPESFPAEGEELLEQITAMGSATFAEPVGQADERLLREAVQAALAATLDTPERVASLDVHAVGQLVVEATGVLTSHDALRLVLGDLLLLWATLGWTRPDWHVRMEAALGPAPAAAAVAGGPSPPAGPMTGAAGTPPPPDEDSHAWEARMARVDALLAERGLAEPEDLAPALDLAFALEEHQVDLPVNAVPWLRRVLRVVAGPGQENDSEKRLNALQALDRAGADVAGAAHLAATARQLSWRTRDAAEVLRVAAAAEDLLAVSADGLAALAAELARLGADPLLVGPALVEVLGRHESAWHAVERAEARRKRAEEDLARVGGRERAARLRLRELEAILRRAAEDQKVAPWLSVSDARLAKAAYEGRVKLG